MQINKLIGNIGIVPFFNGVPFSLFSIWGYKPSKLKQTQIYASFKKLGNAKRWDGPRSADHTGNHKNFDNLDIFDLENTMFRLLEEKQKLQINYTRDFNQVNEDLEQCTLHLERIKNIRKNQNNQLKDQLKEREQQHAFDQRKDAKIDKTINKMEGFLQQSQSKAPGIDEIEKNLNQMEDNLQEYQREISNINLGNFQQKKIDQEVKIDPDIKSNEKESDKKIHPDYSHLWVQCESCYGINYKSLFNSKLYICEWCQSHVQMNSSDRIGFLVDPDTWAPMDEDMFSLDPIEFDYEKKGEPFDFVKWESEVDEIIEEIHDNLKQQLKERETAAQEYFYNILEIEEEEEGEKAEQEYLEIEEEGEKAEQEYLEIEEEGEKAEQEYLEIEEEGEKAEQEYLEIEEEEREKTYEERLDFYQSETGLNDAIQTGIAELNGIPLALGVMDFKFIAGTMGSVVGEKITRLIEYAIKEFLPLIIICASGGARMQEGSLSLMQMSKIACALYTYKLNKKLFYVSILTSPTTGGVTASFGMLGNVILSEPGAIIAFAGRRVIEETLNIEVPEGVQETEYLFHMGAFDLILPRKYFKKIMSLLYLFHNYRLAFA
uniref:Acetyl-coenzyme A carboxylase carboxyl transferase subunit beta n=1 Tax=Hemitomes congestum TaxID=176246 RepID=A0A221SQU5_9ERIC|nr:acetyl-CoA carboxylase carboxyltransferase beta subunit [Hemitomes congestum]ASN78915.1 acetyl-CoA carboxylase carboxyltransferase beta subunit [Hemitomes congestum]